MTELGYTIGMGKFRSSLTSGKSIIHQMMMAVILAGALELDTQSSSGLCL